MTTTEPKSPYWVKSSYSGNGGSCVECALRAASATGTVPVRDSKVPHGPVLGFSADSFRTFLAGVKAGEFEDA